MHKSSIEFRGLGFSYPGKILFKDLDLTLHSGNIYGLLGLNGAGKSTLLHLLSGLLHPTEGSVSAFGHNPVKRSPAYLMDLFVLPEELHLPRLTAKQYVRNLSGFYPRFSEAQFERCMTEFDLPADKLLPDLSHGQKKKFYLSFGLACQSSILIMDEPTNGLDVPSKGLFRRLVAEFATEDRIFIISTHQLRDVESLIDPLLILHNGRMLLQADIEQLSTALHMEQVASVPQDESDILYSEPTVGGHWLVRAGSEPTGHLDLEVLFNAVIAAPGEMQSIVTAAKENSHA